MGAALNRPTLPSRAEYLRAWSDLHGGAATTGLVGWWVSAVYGVASPLARRGVAPDVVTAAGLLVAVAAALPAAVAPGTSWLLLAAALVAISGMLDNLDGAVAVLGDRATRRGFVLDSVCDRLADAAYCLTLYLAGAPGALAVAGAGIAWLHEYVRARAAVAGMPDVGVVTVSERPTRVIVTSMFLLGAGLYPGAASHWAAAGASAWAVIGTVGAVQLATTVVRRLH